MNEWSCIRHNVWTEHFHTRLFLDIFIFVHTSHCGSSVARRVCMTACSCTCHHMSERLLFLCFVFFCLSCLYFLSHFYLSCLELQPPWCREHRALNPMHPRTVRSVAPWRKTIFSQTYHSHEWKFVASWVHFHTHKYGETRKRTKFRFVSETEINVATQKTSESGFSLKAKRANSCWSQTWDPEARTSSRVW